MNVQHIEEQLAEIEAEKGDNEVAHRVQDLLFEDFIQHVADTCQDTRIAEQAKAVLRALTIEFDRWYA